MYTQRFCVYKAVWYRGSLISSFYNKLSDAVTDIKEELGRENSCLYIILIDEGNRIVQIIKGDTLNPFLSQLDITYGKRWKIGVVTELDNV